MAKRGAAYVVDLTDDGSSQSDEKRVRQDGIKGPSIDLRHAPPHSAASSSASASSSGAPSSTPSSFSSSSSSSSSMRPPTLLSSDAGSITIRWTSAAGAAGYKVRLRSADDKEWHTVPQTLTGLAMKKKNLDKAITYLFCVKPVFADGREGPWSCSCAPLQPSSEVVIATWNIGGSGLPSLLAKMLKEKEAAAAASPRGAGAGAGANEDAAANGSNLRAGDIVAELMDTHGIDCLCLQELKGDEQEWRAFREGREGAAAGGGGKKKSSKAKTTGRDAGALLLGLRGMPSIDFFAAFEGEVCVQP